MPTNNPNAGPKVALRVFDGDALRILRGRLITVLAQFTDMPERESRLAELEAEVRAFHEGVNAGAIKPVEVGPVQLRGRMVTLLHMELDRVAEGASPDRLMALAAEFRQAALSGQFHHVR